MKKTYNLLFAATVLMLSFTGFAQNTADAAYYDIQGYYEAQADGSQINTSIVFNGELYVDGGSQLSASSIGGIAAPSGIAKWNGTNWAAVGNQNLNMSIFCMAIFNNELYIAGNYGSGGSGIKKWDGTNFVSIGSNFTGGTNPSINTMVVYNNSLYVAGRFTTIGSSSVNGIARWNGTNWEALTSGTVVYAMSNQSRGIAAMCVYNNELYVTCDEQTGLKDNNTGFDNGIAKWNGTTWSSLGSGQSSAAIHAMTVYNNELYMVQAGGYGVIDGNQVYGGQLVKWDGTTWSIFGSSTDRIDGTVSSITEYNSELYFTGEIWGFYTNGSTTNSDIIKWNGTSWTVFSENNYGYPQPVGSLQNPRIQTSIVYNDYLILGGAFKGNTGPLADTTDFMGINKYNRLIALKPPTSAPTSNASNLNFSNLTNSSVTLNWTPGNGNKRLVLARKDSAVHFTPIQGYEYVANNTYGSGTILTQPWGYYDNNLQQFVVEIAKNYSVYTGTGNSTTVTGLESGQTYHFAVIEYNTTIGLAPNYLFNNILTGSKLILAAEPLTATTNLQISNIAETSLTLNWTNGTGTKRLVIAKAATAVDTIPLDTYTYTGNTTFGSGHNFGNGNYAVYNGTGNTATITGLTPDVIYHFSVFEYNDEGYSGLDNYLTTNAPTAHHTTIAAEPTVSTDTITFTNVSLTSMTVNLTPGNGSHRLVLAKQSSFVNATPVDTIGYTANTTFGSGSVLGTGNYVVYDGTGNSFNLSGLTPDAKYYFASYEYNGSTTPANNYLIANPATAMQGALNSEPALNATAIVFTNVTENSMTLSWTNGDGVNRIVVARTAAVNAAPEDGIEYTANSTFASGDDLGLNNYIVYSGTSNTVNVTGLTPNTTYHFAIYEYNGTNTSNNYLAMNPAIGFKSTLFAEPLSPATNLTLSPITNGITTVSWTNGTGANRVVVVREGLPLNELPDDANGYIANSTFTSGDNLGFGNYICFNGSGNNFNLQGLNPLNVYYVGVLEYNGSGTSANYLTSTFPIASNLPASPTLAASGLTITPNTTTSANVHWTNGDGQYRILIVKAAIPVDELPVDGTVYAPNAAYSSGAQLGTGNFSVYSGTANNTVVTNLDSNVTYHFALFEFNKDAVGPPNYLESPSLTGIYSYNSVGINEATTPSTLTIYPNPTNGKVFIGGITNNAKVTVEVFNTLGKKILQQQNTGEIDLSEYGKGIYTVKVYSDGNIITRKVVLQ